MSDLVPASDDRPQVAAPDVFAALGQINFAHHDLRGVLAEVAALAKSSLVVNGEVSVTLVRDEHAYTAVFTGQPAPVLDDSQYDAGRGPCLDAARSAKTLVISDMAKEDRWPEFARSAALNGVLSSLSLHLPVQTTIAGALNIYSPNVGTFDADAVKLGRTFADYAAVAVSNAHLYDDAAAQARQMREAMEHRAVIDHAIGIIMGERRCNSEDAFNKLRVLSNDTNRKLRDVAAALVAQAQEPVD